MWFRRLIRRPRKPPPFDLTALDRLEQQIARVVALVPQAETAAQEQHDEPSAPVQQSPPSSTSPRPATAYLLFLPGYELVEGRGEAPKPGALLERDGRSYVVLRDGPSPLPDDRRRCIFLATP